MNEENNVQHTKQQNKWKKRYKIPLICLAVLAGIAVVLLMTWQFLKITGYKNLYAQWMGKAPTLDIAVLNDGGETEVGWKEGWIRYDGKIYEYNENILTFLIMGTDADDRQQDISDGVSGGQSDANFLLILNPDKESIQMICINRDTITDVAICDIAGNAAGTIRAQLAIQHAYGRNTQENAQNMVAAVENIMYGLPIHGYCAINMAAIADVNDAVGGITVTCLEDLTKVNWQFKKGAQLSLKGKQAFDYVHYRDTKVFESSRTRLARQKQYLTAFIEQAKRAVKKNPALVVNLYNQLAENMTTDLSLDKVTYLASTALNYSFEGENIMTLAGQTIQGDLYEEFYPDEEELQKLMIEVFYTEVNAQQNG